MRWKFCTMSTKLNRGWTPSSKAISPSSKSRSTSSVFCPVTRCSTTAKLVEIFGLVGPDGAGKTTTLRLLCGLLDPSSGEAWVAGHNVARSPREVKDRIGYMAQRFGLYADLTVEENMDFYADLFGCLLY